MQRQKGVLSFLVLVMGFILLYSCEKVTLREPPPAPIVDSVKFTTDIKPIFSTQKCTDCHKAGGEAPNLKDNPYLALTEGGYINTTTPAESKLYKQITTQAVHIDKATTLQKAKDFGLDYPGCQK